MNRKWQKWAGVAVLILLGTLGQAADTKPGEAPKRSRYDELALKQSAVADKYAKLETLMAKMAEVEAATNPRRAELLKQAVRLSADNLTRAQLDAIVRQLNQKQLGVAMPNQKEVHTELKQLLDLLLSENRHDRTKSEQQRIREYIKEVEALIRKEKDIQGRTEGGDDPKRLAEDQARVAGQTGGLAKKIQENEEGGAGKGQGDSQAKNEGKSKGEGQGDSKGKNEGNSKGDSEGKSKGESEGNKKGDSEGKSKGDSEGKSKGDQEGNSKGNKEGDSKGESEGNKKGNSEGDSKGKSEGKSKGDQEGNSKGNKEGDSKGESEGNKKGNSEGNSKGKSEGNSKGDSEGNSKGNKEGDSKGNSEGNKKGNSEGDSQGGQGDSKGDSEGDSKSGKSQGGKQAKQDNPARKRIQAAEEKMRQAQQKLEEAKRKEALEDEQEARKELEKAKAELEEILRQLREEEVERTLAMLEGRFKKMLELQLRVYEATLRLTKVPEKDRDSTFDIQSSHLSVDEKKIVGEADKALTLLLEEGSSIAFPETVGQMRDDMQQVVDRLANSKADIITTGIEEDIIKALEEIIAALQKAQQDLEKKKQPPGQPPPPGQPQDQPLVDKIAELKMIRALQLRVNTRTTRYSRLLDDPEHPVGQAMDKDVREALGKLGERESKVQQITRDIVLGKNQ